MATLGIDFGNTTCCVATVVDGNIIMLTTDQGNIMMPAYIAYSNGEFLIGESALNQIGRNPENTVHSLGLMLGRRFKDGLLQHSSQKWAFHLIEGNPWPLIELKYENEIKRMNPIELTSMILKKWKNQAENQQNNQFSHAVMCIPASYSLLQKDSLTLAAKNAGFDQVTLLDAPIAAAYAYNLHQSPSPNNWSLVINLGGTFTELSLISSNATGCSIKANSGSILMGGLDFKISLTEDCVRDIQKRYHVSIKENRLAMSRLSGACSNAIRRLSSEEKTEILFIDLFEGDKYTRVITRSEFEDLSTRIFDKILSTINYFLTVNRIDKNRIQNVILVGGTMNIPKLQWYIQDLIPKATLWKNIPSDQVLAYGAARL